MAAEKQGPYPTETPPAYPGPQTSAVGPPMQGFAPPPGAVPPAGYQQAPYPPGPPQPGQPPAGYQPYPPPGVPPGGYVQGQPIAVQPVAQSVVVVQHQQLRQAPVNTVCPHCSQNVITSTRAEAGGLTWLLCAGICLFGFWLGCCLIPFCIDDCQDIVHTCPNCKNTIHVFRRL